MSSDFSVTMSARSVAQEAVSWYLGQLESGDSLQPHALNVQRFLRGPVIALTDSALSASNATETALASKSEGDRSHFPSKTTVTPTSTPAQQPVGETEGKDAERKPTNDSPHPRISVVVGARQLTNWRNYFSIGESASFSLQELLAPKAIEEKYGALSHRAKARLDAFLEGVALAVVSESEMERQQKQGPERPRPSRSTSSGSATDLSLTDGLVGFQSMESGTKMPLRVVSTFMQAGPAGNRTGTSTAAQRCPQLAESELVTRLELYLRCLNRVAALCSDCVIAQEPLKALKARARSVVAAFVNTVGTVRHVSPVLTRLLTALTRELLAVSTLSEELSRVIRNIVSSYVHATSFASLAFLSSPETSADQRLTPAILKYLLFLQKNWERCEADCDLELMLATVLDAELRYAFKTAEFQSIGHLLEVYQGYREHLQCIELPPRLDRRSDEDKVRQAVKDLQREVIAVNGSVLPHVTNRTDLMQLLASALNTRTPFERIRRRSSRKMKKWGSGTARKMHDPESDPHNVVSSGNEADYSASSEQSESSASETETSGPKIGQRASRQRSTFRQSTVDLLTKRLLLAASRTGTGGDAYFVTRDLFGGDDVEVVPSQYQASAVRPATIDLLVRLASVTIKSHASFDVYPKSMVGDCEPLIQIHATTTETIALQEVRATDRIQPSQESSVVAATESVVEMVLRERPTERGGYRFLSVRPALYEKVSVWHTPS